MSKKTTRRKPRRKAPSNDRHRQKQRLLGTFLLIFIALILFFIVYHLLFPSASPSLPSDRRQAGNGAPPVHRKAQGEEGKAKYSFYDQLKKRHEEIKDEVEAKASAEKAPRIEGRHYCIQIGAFRERHAAESVRARMILRDYPVLIVQNGEMHLVQIGPYADRDQALDIQKKLTREGTETVFKVYVN